MYGLRMLRVNEQGVQLAPLNPAEFGAIAATVQVVVVFSLRIAVG